jgi:hypothetical protein
MLTGAQGHVDAHSSIKDELGLLMWPDSKMHTLAGQFLPACADVLVCLFCIGVVFVLLQAVAATRRALSRSRDAETAAKALVERAQRLDSTDNITVVTLLLHGRAIAMPKSNSMLFKRSAALSSAIAAATGGTESPPSCSTPCSGASTPASATPRSSTPSRGMSLISTTSAPAAAMAAAAAAISPQRSLPPPLPLRQQE